MAHERILYEQALRNFELANPASQQLLFPQVIELSPEEYSYIMNILPFLEKIGFKFHRQKGSHRLFVKENKIIVVPMHNKDLKLPTQNNIIKVTGLSQEEFFSYK